MPGFSTLSVICQIPFIVSRLEKCRMGVTLKCQKSVYDLTRIKWALAECPNKFYPRLQSLVGLIIKILYYYMSYNISELFYSTRWISMVRMGPTRQTMWSRPTKEKHHVWSPQKTFTKPWTRRWPSSLLAFMSQQQIQWSCRQTGIGQAFGGLYEWLYRHYRLPILDL